MRGDSPFLALPIELRFKIYHLVFQIHYFMPNVSENSGCNHRYSIDLNLLRVNRQVNKEASEACGKLHLFVHLITDMPWAVLGTLQNRGISPLWYPTPYDHKPVKKSPGEFRLFSMRIEVLNIMSRQVTTPAEMVFVAKPYLRWLGSVLATCDCKEDTWIRPDSSISIDILSPFDDADIGYRQATEAVLLRPIRGLWRGFTKLALHGTMQDETGREIERLVRQGDTRLPEEFLENMKALHTATAGFLLGGEWKNALSAGNMLVEAASIYRWACIGAPKWTLTERPLPYYLTRQHLPWEIQLLQLVLSTHVQRAEACLAIAKQAQEIYESHRPVDNHYQYFLELVLKIANEADSLMERHPGEDWQSTPHECTIIDGFASEAAELGTRLALNMNQNHIALYYFIIALRRAVCVHFSEPENAEALEQIGKVRNLIPLLKDQISERLVDDFARSSENMAGDHTMRGRHMDCPEQCPQSIARHPITITISTNNRHFTRTVPGQVITPELTEAIRIESEAEAADWSLISDDVVPKFIFPHPPAS